MGLLGDLLRSGRGIKDPVEGVAQVVSCSRPPDSATHGTCRFTLVVQAEGIPATSVRHTQIVPTSKWPSPGERLPVTVDRQDPTRLKIRFDDLPTTVEEAEAEAEQIAAALNAGGTAPVRMSGGVEDIVSQLQQAFPGATIQVEGGAAAPPPASDDPVQKLERLAELHRQGLLDAEEFEQAKARILGLD